MQTGLDRRRRGSRFFFIALSLAFIIVLGVSIFTYLSYRQAAAELVIERDRELAYLSASRLKEELLNFLGVLETIGRVNEVASGDPGQRQKALFDARNRLAFFDGGVVLLNNHGRVIAAVPERPDIINQDWSNRDFFRELLISPTGYFSNVVNLGPDGADVVVLSVPVSGSNGEFTGALAGMFRLGQPTLSAFYASIVRLRIGQSGNTYLLDGNRQVLYGMGLDFSNADVNSSELDWLPLEGDRGAVRMKDPQGHDVIAAYATVPGTDWILVIEDDWAYVTRSTQRYTNILFFLLIAGMILPAASVVALVRWQNASILNREFMERDAQMAKRMQKLLLPRQMPVVLGWDIAVHYQPSHHFGGDFHDFFLLPDGNLMIVLAHAEDQGIPAAFLMTTLRAAFRNASRTSLSSSQVMEYCNVFICAESHTSTSIACLHAILDPQKGKIIYSHAGENAPDLCGGNYHRDPDKAPPPFGKDLNTRYTEMEYPISDEGCAFLFSLGLLEVKNPQGEAFGIERLHSIVCRPLTSSQEYLDALLFELEQFSQGAMHQMENITVIAICRDVEEVV